MAEPAKIEELLAGLVEADEAQRLAELTDHCLPLGPEGAGPLLRRLLSSPVKWQRDVAADVANAMKFDPFTEEDEPEETSPEPVLSLGFDDDDSVPPRASNRASPPDLVLVDEDEGPEDAVHFLGPCIEPKESSAKVLDLTAGGGNRSLLSFAWLAAGLALVSGVVVYWWMSPSPGGFLR